MSYVFTRENNFGVMRETSSGEVLVTAEKGVFSYNSGSIGMRIGGTYNFSIGLSQISTINGVVPANGEEACFLLAEVFKGSAVTIIVS